jgi:hypothetical protein
VQEERVSATVAKPPLEGLEAVACDCLGGAIEQSALAIEGDDFGDVGVRHARGIYGFRLSAHYARERITSGSLLLRSASAHVLCHHGVITKFQLGVIHRPETF